MDFKVWNFTDMFKFIRRIVQETDSKYNNVHAQWLCKQDLYKLKWAVDTALKDCKKFEGEDEWVKSQEHKQLLEAIKGGDEKR
jgi:hypothetical protein